jgi:hypothetical protein
MKYTIEMASDGMIYELVPSFMKIHLGIQVIFISYYLDNLRSCSVDIANGKDL